MFLNQFKYIQKIDILGCGCVISPQRNPVLEILKSHASGRRFLAPFWYFCVKNFYDFLRIVYATLGRVKPIRHTILIIRHIIFRTCRIIFAIILVDWEMSRKIYTDNQVVKKEVLPVSVRPPFLQYKDNTFFREMQIPFLGVIAEECEKSLQMGRGQIGCRDKKQVIKLL